jgi:predicted permease
MPLRLALRRLTATPAFTVGAIAVLALGSGATLAVFTVLNALVFKTLPVSEPDRLVAIEVQTARGEPAALPSPLFEMLVRQQQSLDRVAGVLGGSVVSADAGGVTHQAVVDGVTEDYFSLLGLSMISGRPLGNIDYQNDGANADAVCVISEGYARRLFGHASDALGRPLTLGEATVHIVGIMSDGFSGVQIGVRTDVVVPSPVVGHIIGLEPAAVPMRHVFGRLAAGRTVDDARAEWSALWLSALATSAQGRLPAGMAERRLVVAPGATGVSVWRARYQGPLEVTMVASAWLVVIACANLAGLQLTRVLRRAREIAVARALGATQAHVMRPTALESLLICTVGLLLGAPLAAWGARAATDLLSTGSVPLDLDLRADRSTWAMMAGLATLVTLVAGLVPAWLATRRAGGLAPDARVVSGGGRASAALVAGQIALAVVLLTGTVVAVDALLRVALRDHGFAADHVVVAQLMNRPGGYADLDDAVYYRALIDRIERLPGVSAVALAKPVPGLSSRALEESVTGPGVPDGVEAAIVMASPGYFDLLGIPLLAGRTFEWRDSAGSPPVAVISRALAGGLMPDGFTPGLRIDVGRRPYHRALDVVGIADDASVLNVRDDAPRVVYVAALQQPPPMARWPGLIVRTHMRVESVTPAIAHVIDQLGHEFVLGADALSGHITRSLARERLLAMLAVVYGLLAMSMVAIGLWALLSHDVTRRVREFGVRLSLGASPAALHRAVTGRAMRLATAGTAVGATATWLLSRALSTNASLDWPASSWAVAGACGLLLLLAACAAMGPAGRAARTEPMAALRSE